MSEAKTVKRLLPVQLDEDTLAVRAQELAQAEIYRGQVERDYAAEADEWKEAKKLHESKILTASSNCLRLGKVVKDRAEERDVECEVEIKAGQFTLTRLDTGEVVLQRPATPGELQMAFPTDEDDEEPEAKAAAGRERVEMTISVPGMEPVTTDLETMKRATAALKARGPLARKRGRS